MRIGVSGTPPCDLGLARRAIRAALRPFRPPTGATLALAFVEDAAMRELNSRYRGRRTTTDVLSFGQRLPEAAQGAAAVDALRADPDGTIDLGDLVISSAQAARQARRRRRSLEREVAFLAAHGALHLVGFEDDTPRGYREMVRLGRAALAEAAERA
ncbi:MAG: rRNA maturation RNase YbeY [Candidatus Limnocylindria bacterium]